MRSVAELTRPGAFLLDLDGTLYPSTLGLERQIIPSLRRAVAEVLGKPLAEAIPIVQDLNKRYGYCVRGLEKEFGIDPHTVVDRTYRALDRTGIVLNQRLRDSLSVLARFAPVIVLTNSSRGHAEDALSRLGVLDLIHRIFAIEDVGFFLKPDTEVYVAVRSGLGIPFADIMYFDDSVRNLHSAWSLGVANCVLVGNGLAEPPLFWENHLRIRHYPPDHMMATHDLPALLSDIAQRLQ